MGTHRESIGESWLKCWQSNGYLSRGCVHQARRKAQHSCELKTCSTSGAFPHTVTVSTRFTEELGRKRPRIAGNNSSGKLPGGGIDFSRRVTGLQQLNQLIQQCDLARLLLSLLTQALSFWSASRIATSACLCAVISRAIAEAPTIFPECHGRVKS